MFEATLSNRSAKGGHYFLEDVQCENGMRRAHCWVNATNDYLGPLPMPSHIKIDAKYRRYRPGRNGWTITKIRSVEVLR